MALGYFTRSTRCKLVDTSQASLRMRLSATIRPAPGVDEDPKPERYDHVGARWVHPGAVVSVERTCMSPPLASDESMGSPLTAG